MCVCLSLTHFFIVLFMQASATLQSHIDNHITISVLSLPTSSLFFSLILSFLPSFLPPSLLTIFLSHLDNHITLSLSPPPSLSSPSSSPPFLPPSIHPYPPLSPSPSPSIPPFPLLSSLALFISFPCNPLPPC